MIVDLGDTILVEGVIEDGALVHPAIVTRVMQSTQTFGGRDYTGVDCTLFLARRPPMLLTELKVYRSKQIAQDELDYQREANPEKVEMAGWPK